MILIIFHKQPRLETVVPKTVNTFTKLCFIITIAMVVAEYTT